MLRAVSHAHSGSAEPHGTVVLDSTGRHLRRKLIRTDQGEEVMVDFPAAVLLSDGDVLVLEDGRTIRIVAAREELYEVRPGAHVPLRHIAWHLGNRHLAAQIDDDRILIRRDHVIRDMLIGLGATLTETVECFQPVHGAYHGHEAHGHQHGQHHHEQHPAGKPDSSSHAPGDPHDGHEHA